MSNVKLTARQSPLTFIVEEDEGTYSLTAIRGAMEILKAAESDLGTDAFAGDDADASAAHFAVARPGLLPVRHLHISARAVGTDAANVDATLWLECWDPDMALWATSGEMHIRGATVRATALAADAAGLSNIHWVDVPSGATHARVVVLGLAADQGVTLVAHGDNDD